MKKAIGKRVLATVLALTLMITASATFMFTKAQTYDMQAEVTLASNLSTYDLNIDTVNTDNNAVTMNYTVGFEPISKDNVPDTVTPKEVVIIFDTSGSMGNDLNGSSRLSVAKAAAINLLNDLNSQEDVKVSLVNYSSKAYIYNESNPLLDLSTGDNYDDLVEKINSYDDGGYTNIGDSIRRGNYILQKANTDRTAANDDQDVEQFIIVLTDGEPTALSIDSYDGSTGNRHNDIGKYYYNSGSNSDYVKEITSVSYLRTDGGPEKYMIIYSSSNDAGNYSLNYAKEMAGKLSTDLPNINSYYVAFSDAANSNKLSLIADESDGVYFTATTADSLNLVYDTIADDIISELTLEEVVFEEVIPNGITALTASEGVVIDGQTISKTFGSVSYILNEEETYYVAEDQTFSVVVSPEGEGIYNFGTNNSSGYHYVDLDGYGKHLYFPVRTLSVTEDDPNLSPDNQLDILEVQPGRVFELNEDVLNNALNGLTVDVDQMSMNEFDGNIEKVNGKYDIVYIGAIEDYDDYTMTGMGDNTIRVDIDITDRKAVDIIEFAESGQLLIVDEELNRMTDSKIKANLSDLMELSNVKEVPYFNPATVDSLQDWYANATHRPRLTVLSEPKAYDGTKDSFEEDHFMSFLYTAYSEQSNGMDTYLSIDLDGDGLFESNEQMLKEDVSINASGLSLNYSLEEGFNGLMPWKLELVDEETNAKDYIIGFSAYEGTKTVVNVLQLSPGTNRMDIDSNTFIKPLDTDDYEINITYMQVSDFDAAYAAWENSDNEYPLDVDGNPTVLNGNYDMIIFGFGDSYGGQGGPSTNKDLDSQAAVDAVDNFIKTGQSILFTHDTAGPQDFANNFETRDSDDKLWNNIVTYNDAPNITQNFKDDMGFNNIRTYAGKKMWRAWGSSDAYKLNEGLITMYPYLLADNTSKTLDIASTHDQYWHIDLEGENVVPWFTLDAGNFKYYPAAYYYTFTNGNITYSGTGHSTPNGAEEQEFFVNTMLKAARGANHAPTMDVADLYEGMNIVPSVDTVEFELTIHDIDFQDQSFTTEVYTLVGDQEIRVKLLSDVSKEVPFDITFNKPPVLDESVEEFVIKVVVTDEHGAQGIEEFNVTHKEVPTLVVSDNLEDGYLKGDLINLTYEVDTVKEIDKDLISDIHLETTIDTSKSTLVEADQWSASGNTYSVSPSFSGNTTYNMTLRAGYDDTLALTGTYDVVFSAGGDVMEDQPFSKDSAVNVKVGMVNVEVSDNLGRAIESATVEVTNSAGVVVASGLTDIAGIYKTTGLTTDVYNVALTALPVGYDTLDVDSEDVTLNYNNAVQFVEFSAKDNAKPLIETEYAIDIVITGDTGFERPVHVKVDGNRSKVVAVYTKKLGEDEMSAEVNDFVGANAADNEVLEAYDPSNSDDELKVTPFTLDDTKPEDFEKAGYFLVTENGYYAIYAINEAGNETVEVIHINSLIKELPDNL